MRRKHFKLFLSDKSWVILPYLVTACTGGFIGQKKSHMSETTKNCMFIHRTVSWLHGNCCMRYKPLIELNRKWPLIYRIIESFKLEILWSGCHWPFWPQTPSWLMFSCVDRDWQVLSYWPASQPLFSQPVVLHTVVVTQGQEPALCFFEPHTVVLDPLIQTVQIPLKDLPPLQQMNIPAQLSVICKVPKGALDPIIHTIDKNIEQGWPQYWVMGAQFVTGHWLDVAPFTTILWVQPPSQFLIQLRRHVAMKLFQKNIEGVSAKGFANIWVE